MLPAYNNKIEVIETVYTYEEWLKEYNRREEKRKIRQREELNLKQQKMFGFVLVCCGFIGCVIFPEDCGGFIMAALIGITRTICS